MSMTQGHWLWGYAREMAAAPHRFPAELGWKFGGLAPYRVLHKSLVAVTHPDYAKHILVTHQERYQRSFQYRNHQLIVGKGLLSTDGDIWLKRRRQALPAFRPEVLRRIVPATCMATEELLKRWESSRDPVPVVADMQRLSMSVIGRALLSTDLQEEDATRFGQAVRESLWLVRKRNTSVLNAPMMFPTRDNQRLRETRNILDTYLNSHVAARRGGEQQNDMLDALLQARDPDTKEPLPHQALLDETKTLFIAGFETTATALAWTLYLLARHRQAAERCHEEVMRTLNGRLPAWEDLEKLVWTSQVINEALRLYPPVYTMARECTAEDVIDGRAIRRGTIAVISIYGIHRAEQWWPEPFAFRPERFDECDSAPNAFLPFGLGKHVCIGNNFAMIEMKLILAMIAQKFRLELVDDREVTERAQITLVPSREIPLRLIPRSPKSEAVSN
jgi:enediyne biosynthesis protein E7